MTSGTAPSTFGLLRDAFGRLVLIDAAGERHEGVTPIRAFPLSEPERWISLCDPSGHELALVEDIATLPEASRALLTEELSQRMFVPVITRIVSVSGVQEPVEWEVETDRGPTRLVLRSEDDLRRLGAHGLLIASAAGVRYLLPDARTLDELGRRAAERYL